MTAQNTQALADALKAAETSFEALAKLIRAESANNAFERARDAAAGSALYVIVANGEMTRARGWERAMAVTRDLADKGHTVTVTRVTQEALRALQESAGSMRAAHPVATAPPADIASPGDLDAVLRAPKDRDEK